MSKVKLLICCQLAACSNGMGSILRTALLMHLWGFVRSLAVKSEMSHMNWLASQSQAAIAQLGERQTEDPKVPGSIPGLGKFFPAGGARGPGFNSQNSPNNLSCILMMTSRRETLHLRRSLS